MTSEGLGEMFEGDSADTCAGKFPFVSSGGRAEGLACADLGARTPIGASEILFFIFISNKYFIYPLPASKLHFTKRNWPYAHTPSALVSTWSCMH